MDITDPKSGDNLPTLEDAKERAVVKRVRRYKGHRSRAARSLDISLGTLRKYVRRAEEKGASVPGPWHKGRGRGLGLTPGQIRRVRQDRSKTLREYARQFGVGVSTVWRARNKKGGYANI